MNKELEFRKIVKSAIIAYLGGVGMVVFALAISLSHGAGFKPLLILLPLFIIVFGGITYQFIKDIRALRREKSEDPKQ